MRLAGALRGSAGGTRVAILVNAADAGMLIVGDNLGRDRFYLAGDTGLRAASGDLATVAAQLR